MKTVDYAPRHAWDQRLGLVPGSVEQVVHGSPSWIQAQTGALPVSKYWADVAAQLGLDAQELEQLQRDFFKGDQLDEDLIGLIYELREAQHPVALLSNDSPALLKKLQLLGIDVLFDALIVSAQIGVMKPHPAAYRAALDNLRYPPHRTVFLDDNPENVNGAEAVGISAIHYQPGMDVRAAFAPLLTS